MRKSKKATERVLNGKNSSNSKILFFYNFFFLLFMFVTAKQIKFHSKKFTKYYVNYFIQFFVSPEKFQKVQLAPLHSKLAIYDSFYPTFFFNFFEFFKNIENIGS